jgi:hypothetical protein
MGYFAESEKGVVCLPMLVQGKLHLVSDFSYDKICEHRKNIAPNCISTLDNIYILPWYSNSKMYYILLPKLNPKNLLENPSIVAKELYSLPLCEFLSYIQSLQCYFLENKKKLQEKLRDIFPEYLFLIEQIPYLLDKDGIIESLNQELTGKEGNGIDYLEKWQSVETKVYKGWNASIQEKCFHLKTETVQPQIRAIPTRQLHITAGNSPILCLLSFLRGLSTKGACTIKSSHESVVVHALLSLAMHTVAPNHPITKHTSLVYWKGGDHSIEDTLFAPYAYDRIVVWGSPETVQSIRMRALHTKTLYLNPRYGLSLIGNIAFQENLEDVAIRACSDSLIVNQKACTASLVHYIEGSEEQALEYCQQLQKILSRWDQCMPHIIPQSVIGEIRMLRRKELFYGTWFENGSKRHPTSHVVYMPHDFDLSVHPMSRFIIVQRLDKCGQIQQYINESVSTIGIYPETIRHQYRDQLAAYGVSNILPLGHCEQMYPGMPHDNMRILSELCNWINS